MDKKNILYIKTVDLTWMDVASRLQEKYGWQPVLWVSHTTDYIPEARKRYRDAYYYEHSDARRGLPPKDIPGFDLAPVDASLYEKVSGVSDVVFEMMSRFGSGKDAFSYEDRKHLFLNMLRIWVAILTRLEIDIVAIASVPHRVYDFVAYLLCQELGIPYLMIEQTLLPHCSYGISSISDRSKLFRDEIGSIGEDFQLSHETEECLRKAVQSYDVAVPAYFQELVIKAEQRSVVRKIYDQLPSELQVIPSLINNFVRGRLFQKSNLLYFKRSNTVDSPEYASYFRNVLEQRKINKAVQSAVRWYNKHAVKPDLKRPYIYFAAHFQPERTTCPDAWLYHDHSLIIDLLSKALPDGWLLYYKEHPTIFRRPIRSDNPRDVRYFKRILQRDNVRLVDYQENSFTLIDNAMAVASAVGTVLWEGVLRGKPALYFGDAWFNGCHGMFNAMKFGDCRHALDLIENGFVPDQKEVRRYVAVVEKHCKDLQWRLARDACIKDLLKDDPDEYKRRIQLLADVLADEYLRVNPVSG